MPGSETRRKTATTTLRLDLEELASLRAVAAAAGLGPSAFLRNVALQAIGAKPRARPLRGRRDQLATVLKDVLGDLGVIGNNVNQLARHANRGGRVDPAAQASLEAQVERLTLAVMALRETPHDS